MFGGERRGVRRAHSPDGYENTGHFDGNFNRGPPQWAARGYNHQYFKRYRGEHEQYHHLSLEDKIKRLGDIGFRKTDIGILAKEIDTDLIDRGQEEERVKKLTAEICRSIMSFPTRLGTYATLIGLISVKHYNIACQIINILHASYPIYLEAQKWQEALTIVHLLASLVNCKVIRPSALLSQFELLLECTVEDSIPQARSDYYVYTVLSSLPYIAQELATQPETQENFEKIISTIETYLAKRSKNHLNAIRIWLSSDSTIQMDYLDSLWVQMKNFRATGWNETLLYRPYNDKEYRDTMASSLIPTNSPTFQIPGHSEKYIYPCPKIVFRLYEDDVTDGPKAIPGSDKIERFVIENHIRNVIDELSGDLKSCARHLIHMNQSDQLPMKHLLIETILGELFTLPKPKYDEVLYFTLLYEISKLFHPSKNQEEPRFNYDVVLNEAVKVLYDNLDSMNVTCISRFIRWFSFHLNNTEFIFPWQNWEDANSRDRTSPKSRFVQDILDRCVRLSFHKKIGTLVQAHLSALMPPEKEIEYKPVFLDHPRAGEFATMIKRLIIEKADGKMICQTLNIVIDGVVLPDDFVLQEEKLADQLFKIDIFFAVILEIASKSLTHLSSALGKYRNVLRALTSVPQGRIQMLQTMNSCLKKHPQLQVILVDKLLKAELADPRDVCYWVFSESMKPHHTESYPWELLGNTIYRVQRTLETLEEQRNEPNGIVVAGSISDLHNKSSKKQKDKDDDKAGGGNTPEHKPDMDMLPAPQDDEQSEERKAEAIKRDREERDRRIENAHIAYKDILIEVFRLFSTALSDHIRDCEKSQLSFIDDKYRWLTGRMQEVYYNHLDTIRGFYDEIRTIIDPTPSIGSMVVNLNQ